MAVAAAVPDAPVLGRPDAIVDLQTEEGCALVGASWRYADAAVREIAFVEVGRRDDPLAPGTVPNRTYDVEPHAEGVTFDDSAWRRLSPAGTRRRLGGGRVCFGWYRVGIELPPRIGDTDVAGCTVLFEVTVDDYAEVWADGRLPVALGDVGGPVVAGFNAPNRVLLTSAAEPGDRFTIAVFAMNGPISASPRNYLWLRGATLELHAPAGPSPPVARVATGLPSLAGAVWSRADGSLLLAAPAANEVLRWRPDGRVTVVRSKSGYSGVDVGRFAEPGASGLTYDPAGRLLLCQHGHRRVLRVNPHGDETVLADRYDGRRLNSPQDVVCRGDGSAFFTDPPSGLPAGADDPARELPFSGVFRVREGREAALVAADLDAPGGIALSPDERVLYVASRNPSRRVVLGYDLDADGDAVGVREVLEASSAAGDGALGGLAVDALGTVYACAPDGVWVLSPEGEHRRTLRLPGAPHDLAWGDADGRSLYVTASTGVFRVRTDVPGIRP